MPLDPHWELIRAAQREFVGDFPFAIHDVVKAEAWKSYTRPMAPETTTPATFGDFIRDVFDCEPEVIEAVLRHADARALAEVVMDLISSERESLQAGSVPS